MFYLYIACTSMHYEEETNRSKHRFSIEESNQSTSISPHPGKMLPESLACDCRLRETLLDPPRLPTRDNIRPSSAHSCQQDKVIYTFLIKSWAHLHEPLSHQARWFPIALPSNLHPEHHKSSSMHQIFDIFGTLQCQSSL